MAQRTDTSTRVNSQDQSKRVSADEMITEVGEIKKAAGEMLEQVAHVTEDIKRSGLALRRELGQYTRMAVDYTRRHPWRVAFGAAGIGLLVGVLISRRNSD